MFRSRSFARPRAFSGERRAARSRIVVLVAVAGTVLALLLLPATPASAAPPVATFTAALSDTNLVTLTWTVTGNDSSNLVYIYEDIGFKAADCIAGAPSGCSVTVRVKKGGVYRYLFSVKNAAGQFTNIAREVAVPWPTRPTVPSERIHVDKIAKTAPTLSWSHDGPANDIAHHYVQVVKNWTTTLGAFPPTGTYTVPVSELPFLGDTTYTISYCVRPDLTQTPICSTAAPVTVVVEPGQFAPAGRRMVPAGQAVTLSFEGAGNQWFFSAPSLGISGQWTSTPSITIPAAQVVNGVHDVKVVNCFYAGACSNREDIRAPKAGTVHHVFTYGQDISWWLNVATLTPSDGSAPIALNSPATGKYLPSVAEGALVSANDVVGSVVTNVGGTMQLVVGLAASVPSFQTVSLTSGFNVQNLDTSMLPGAGSGLDITFDASGGVWGIGEFHTTAAQIQGSTVSPVEPPTGRVWNPGTGRYEKTKPFGTKGSTSPVPVSALGERIIDTGSAIWFTQGGGGGSNNYSRLVRISRTTADDPATPDDDRVCAVHLPGVDQQVLGVAYDPGTNRVWYGEQDNAGQTKALNWFLDGDLACNNGLQYQVRDATAPYAEHQNQAAIDAAGAANRCASPSSTHCIHRLALPIDTSDPAHPKDISAKPAQLAVDAASGYLWITDWSGWYLSRVPLNANENAVVQSFPLPAQALPGGYYRGYPWQIRVDANAVYFTEYNDNQLVRFDKALAAGGTCGALNAAGANPCIRELFLPMGGNQVRAHSLALRNGKLWFTVGAEAWGTDAPNGSYFGYIDTASWTGTSAPTGVIYNGLSALGPPPTRTHWSLRGIEVSPSGKVALAEMSSALLVLTPKP